MMWWYGHGWNGSGWVGVIVAALILVAVVAAAVVALVALLRRSREPGAPTDEAVRILEQRFARGEIDADEFEKRRQLLHHR